MSRYIDAEKAKQELNVANVHKGIVSAMQSFIDDVPTADVAEVKHGKWLLEREPDGKPYCFHCSVCDADFGRISIVSATPFCPWCGAKMDLEVANDTSNL